MISYRRLTEEELYRLADIDRSEVVRVGFEAQEGQLVQTSVEWNVSNFIRTGEGEHTVAEQIEFCKGHLDAGAIMIGAFSGDQLVGIGLLTPELRPRIAQLSYLQVSAPYRRQGIASALTHQLLTLAMELGADHVYVSATPSQSAVEFYLHLGFELVAEPLPELLALEPDDIHMRLTLRDTKPDEPISA